ncbi:MAG TPA: hypothetical protein VFX02_09400 [Gammaproteobacteria bacterium]|nr:hypothetical protein [Gammaproteobacteria bacterium]
MKLLEHKAIHIPRPQNVSQYTRLPGPVIELAAAEFLQLEWTHHHYCAGIE